VKRGAIILLLGLLVGAAAFGGFYYLGTASSRGILSAPEPELAWLKREFKLSDSEYARITNLHQSYLPACRERCLRIAEQDRQLQQLLARASTVTPEIQNLLAERAKTRADCEGEMLKHFLEVSRTMQAEQGRRYLVWVESQSCLRGQAMEQAHDVSTENSEAGHHHH
jgi:hypothetical protein